MPEIIFNGPEGRLEGRYQRAKEDNAPIALILHPHPQFGGTMNDKITYEMYHMFARRGFAVMRFNFRGVGKSEGEYDQGQGELSDAATALDYLQSLNPAAPFAWVGGFSFGAYVGMQLLMRRPEIKGFISVAPPANSYDFSFLAPCPSSGLMVHGDKDENVPLTSVEKLVHKLHHQRDIQIDYRIVNGADHSFRDHTAELEAHVVDYLTKALKEEAAASATS